jgi:hypothetical protein
MRYEVKNVQENRTKILQLGSEPRLVTESIEFDLLVITDRCSAEGHLIVETMIPTDFQEYVEKIANKIAKDIEEKSAIRLDNIEVSVDLSYEG